MMQSEVLEHYFGNDVGGLTYSEAEAVIELAECLTGNKASDRVSRAMRALGLEGKYLTVEGEE